MITLFQPQPVAEQAGRWDRAGIIVSAACAVHCTLLPLVAGLLPILGLQHFADERFEWLIVAVTALIGVIGHARAYVRHHQHVGPALLFLVGLGTIVIARLSRSETALEPLALGIGGLFAAAAHWFNLRLCRCCARCVDDSHLPLAGPGS